MVIVNYHGSQLDDDSGIQFVFDQFGKHFHSAVLNDVGGRSASMLALVTISVTSISASFSSAMQ